MAATLVHPSRRPLPAGSRLTPRGEGFADVDADVEEALEAARPAHRRRRDACVYMVEGIAALAEDGEGPADLDAATSALARGCWSGRALKPEIPGDRAVWEVLAAAATVLGKHPGRREGR